MGNREIKKEVDVQVAQRVSELTEENVYYVKRMIQKIKEEDKYLSVEIAILSTEIFDNSKLLTILRGYRNTEIFNDISAINPNYKVVVIDNSTSQYSMEKLREFDSTLSVKGVKFVVISTERIESKGNIKPCNDYDTFLNRLEGVIKEIFI